MDRSDSNEMETPVDSITEALWHGCFDSSGKTLMKIGQIGWRPAIALERLDWENTITEQQERKGFALQCFSVYTKIINLDLTYRVTMAKFVGLQEKPPDSSDLDRRAIKTSVESSWR